MPLNGRHRPAAVSYERGVPLSWFLPEHEVYHELGEAYIHVALTWYNTQFTVVASPAKLRDGTDAVSSCTKWIGPLPSCLPSKEFIRTVCPFSPNLWFLWSFI